MRKQISWLRHLSILFLTIVIFTIGVLIGGNVEGLRVQNLYTQLQEQDLDYQTLVTESQYIDYIIALKEQGDEVSCELIEGTYYTSIANLDSSRIKLENYINSGSVKTEEFSRLKDHYSNIQINYWILANKVNNLCGSDMNTILYFYADDNVCPECQDQGVHLSYVKQRLADDVLIFSLDSQRGGAIKLLAQKYDINSLGVPAIVIGEEVYGYSSNKEIFDILCDNGLSSSVCND
jgi:hypothetical protein